MELSLSNIHTGELAHSTSIGGCSSPLSSSSFSFPLLCDGSLPAERLFLFSKSLFKELVGEVKRFARLAYSFESEPFAAIRLLGLGFN